MEKPSSSDKAALEERKSLVEVMHFISYKAGDAHYTGSFFYAFLFVFFFYNNQILLILVVFSQLL